MCLPPLTWQTYDVDFTAAEYKDGKKVKNARMTVRHNGVVIHKDVELPKSTTAAPVKPDWDTPAALAEYHDLLVGNHRLEGHSMPETPAPSMKSPTLKGRKVSNITPAAKFENVP